MLAGSNGHRLPPAMTAAAALAPWLAERLGLSLRDRQPVGGGCIHRAWRLRLEGSGSGPTYLFAKTNRPDALPLLEAEADGLAALAKAAEGSGLVVPQPLALGLVGGEAVLVLPWLDLGLGPGADPARTWAAVGAGLARLHRRSLVAPLGPGDRLGSFGWCRDNAIGTAHQANGWIGNWSSFFAERRLAPQLETLARSGRSLAGAEALVEQLDDLLADHEPDACLVHGDLWSGNLDVLSALAATCQPGQAGSPLAVGALFDPASYRGDREVDLAMARLFGGVPQAFFDGYGGEWPLPPGHEQRVCLYNLYHLLNHANMFPGGGYDRRAEATVKALGALLNRGIPS
jgi:fructosamine-3-kinase